MNFIAFTYRRSLETTIPIILQNVFIVLSMLYQLDSVDSDEICTNQIFCFRQVLEKDDQN